MHQSSLQHVEVDVHVLNTTELIYKLCYYNLHKTGNVTATVVPIKVFSLIF